MDRPNRFIAHVETDGGLQVCHVKNTGRCRELLTPGTRVVLRRARSPKRRTAYDLVAVWKGDLMVNIDSQAPNVVFEEWATASGFPEGLTALRREVTKGDSRFDFYFEAGARRGFIEVKGVTLENGGVAAFPDAPTQRGAKHLRGLIKCVEEGMEAYAVFVVQMAGMKCVVPNRETDPEFTEALREARRAGVKIVALECAVAPDDLRIIGAIPTYDLPPV